MLAALIVLCQVAIAQPPPEPTYASAALREMVRRAAVSNGSVPPALAGYEAHIESEITIILSDTLGRERTGGIEQLGGTARWNPRDGFLVHVEGYRSHTVGVPVMGMSSVVRTWALPMLYGQRLLLGLSFSGPPEERPARVGQRRDTLRAVHPFADDRDRYYRFTGGDTVGFITTASKRIPIARIFAHPILALDANFGAFDGEIDIDAERNEIVRMRGRFVVSQRMARLRGLGGAILRASGAVGVAYAEFANAEHEGHFWLPSMQRVEVQATNSFSNGLRYAVRIVSNFADYQIQQTTSVEPRTVSPRRTTTYAPPDSLERFRDWRTEMGKASSSVSVTDFDDIAPPAWRTDGPPRLRLLPSRYDRVLHYNRIEGLFTGMEATLEPRDLAPGVLARAYGGWAWSEKTVRGGVSLSRSWSRSSTAIVAERRLAGTQDFQRDFAGASSLSSFFSSVEEADWVDRRALTIAHVRTIESIDHALLIGRLGVARDGDVSATLAHGPVVRSRLFLPNRHAATGSYGLAAFTYEFHPNVTGELLEPGIGATIGVDAAAGQLAWIRSEASLSARRFLGPLTLATRVDGGIVIADAPPPQTLFELGGIAGRLSGYDYKEFAGDRAAIGRAFAAFSFPILRAPHRFGRWLMPGLTPGIAAGIDGGWTELSSPAARAAVLSMGDGTEANAVSHETGRIRSSVNAGLTFFSHSVQVGMARPIDEKAPWRWAFRFGQSF